MNNIYNLVLKNFFKENEKFNNKSFLIDANDEILLDKNDNRKTISGTYFKLYISKVSNDLKIRLSLYSWCNETQTYVPLKKSIWSEEGFGGGKYISKIENHYKKIIENFLSIFRLIKYYWQLKEIIHKLENPIFSFHYKLLNTFSREFLEKFSYKPYFVRDLKYRGRYILKFQGIPNVEIEVKADGTFDVLIILKFKNKIYFSNPLDLTTVIKKDKKGFYCDLCIKKVYFKNKAEICDEHLNEWFIPWVKDNLKIENQLVLNIWDGCDEIVILPKDCKDLKENSRCFSLFPF